MTDEVKDMGPEMNSADPKKLGTALNELADEIKAGKYKTAQEAQMAMGMKMMSSMGQSPPVNRPPSRPITPASLSLRGKHCLRRALGAKSVLHE